MALLLFNQQETVFITVHVAGDEQVFMIFCYFEVFLFLLPFLVDIGAVRQETNESLFLICVVADLRQVTFQKILHGGLTEVLWPCDVSLRLLTWTEWTT